MSKFEEKIINFLEKNYLILAFILVTFLAIMGRLFMFNFVSRDFTSFLSPWFDFLKNNGGLKALANYPGDYNAPYVTILALLTYIPIKKLYLIKIVSVLFDFGLAIATVFLVKHLNKNFKRDDSLFVYSIMLFVPEIILNSSAWAQCDAGYALFIVLALLFLFKEKYITSFIMLGVAFSLKLQTVFILPLFIVVYIINKKFSIFYFLIIPFVNFVLSLPALLYGMPFMKMFNVYVGQIKSYDYALSLNFLNIYELIPENGLILSNLGIIMAFMACLLILLYLISKKIKLNNQKMLNLGLWFVVVITFLLPRMHDRYLYVGCVLSVIYFMIYKKNFFLMLNIIIASLITYISYLFGVNFPYRSLFVVVYMFTIAFYTKDLLKMLNDIEDSKDSKKLLFNHKKKI